MKEASTYYFEARNSLHCENLSEGASEGFFRLKGLTKTTALLRSKGMWQKRLDSTGQCFLKIYNFYRWRYLHSNLSVVMIIVGAPPPALSPPVAQRALGETIGCSFEKGSPFSLLTKCNAEDWCRARQNSPLMLMISGGGGWRDNLSSNGRPLHTLNGCLVALSLQIKKNRIWHTHAFFWPDWGDGGRGGDAGHLSMLWIDQLTLEKESEGQGREKAYSTTTYSY